MNSHPNIQTHQQPNESESIRTLTILMCDLVNSTWFSERLSSEALCELLNDFYAASNKIVCRNRGRVIRCVGDAVYAVFESSSNNETCTTNAANAAIELNRTISKHTIQINGGVHSFSSRISISTGPGLLSYIPITNQEAIFGKLPFIAERLKASVEPDEIALNIDAAQFLRKRFNVAGGLELSPKGMSNKIQIWKLVNRKNIFPFRSKVGSRLTFNTALLQ